MKRFAAAFALLLPGAPAFAGLSITQLLLDKGSVILSAEMNPVSPPRLPEFLDDGMNVKIEIQCTLYRKSGVLIPDEPITNVTARYIIKKDVINSGFTVGMEGLPGGNERWFETTNDLVPFLMRFGGIRVGNLNLVGMEGTYFVDTQFHVIALELYPPLSLIFNLIGNWNYTSPKVRSKNFNRSGIFND